jgi:hypothetical protein
MDGPCKKNNAKLKNDAQVKEQTTYAALNVSQPKVLQRLQQQKIRHQQQAKQPGFKPVKRLRGKVTYKDYNRPLYYYSIGSNE